jgi:hypothetical protein
LRGLRLERAAIVLGQIGSLPPGDIAQAVHALLTVPSRLQEISQAASGLVDGRGAKRVIEVVKSVCSQDPNPQAIPAGFGRK